MISSVLSIAQLTSVSLMPPSASLSTTITRPPVIEHHQSPSKAQNTSTYMKIVSARTTKTELCSLSTFLASSMPAISLPRRLKMTPTSVAVATPSWCQEVTFMKFGHCVPTHLTSKALLPYYSLHSKVSPETFSQSLMRSPKLTASAARTVSDRPSAVHFERGVLLPKQLQSAICRSNLNCSSVVHQFTDSVHSSLFVALK
jgi:hypothetical protein